MITIRGIGPSEAFIAARFAEALLNNEPAPPWYPNVAIEAEIREGLENGSVVVLVAIHGKMPVGMLQVIYRDLPSIGRHVNAGCYYLRIPYRNRGIGRKLIAATVKMLSAPPDYPILCQADDDLDISYRKLGFRTVTQIHQGGLSTIRAIVDPGKNLGLEKQIRAIVDRGTILDLKQQK